MNITKQQLSVLQFIYRKKSTNYAAILKKFKSKLLVDELLSDLLYNEYIYCIHGSYDTNGDLVPLTDSSIFQLNQIGVVEVEKNQWFNVQYFLSSLIVPIIVGVASSIITALLLNFI